MADSIIPPERPKKPSPSRSEPPRPEPPLSPSPPSKPPTKYRVRTTKVVSLGGIRTRLAEGKILEVRLYGATIINSLREQGVELDPL